jgi:hypothetical protein
LNVFPIQDILLQTVDWMLRGAGGCLETGTIVSYLLAMR